MKKKMIFAAVASLALFSCSNDEYVGEAPMNSNASQAINFGVGNTAFTRSEAKGANAATELYNQFNVYGAKYDATNSKYTPVFNNYKVWYNGSTSDSNTKGWEYVGKKGAAYGTGTSFTGTLSNEQTIKYWDYSSDKYMFWAISPAKYTLEPVTTTSTTTPTVGEVYSFSLTDAEPGVAIRVAYPKKVVKADYSGNKAASDAAVTMKFITFQGMARVALYDAVPGYKINNVKFYTDNATKAGDNNAYLYRLDGKNFSTKANYTFKFDNTIVDVDNKDVTGYGKISTEIGTRTATEAFMNFGALNYTTYTEDKTNAVPEGKFLSESAAAPTYAGNGTDDAVPGNYYWNILPDDQLEELYLKVDFTLTSDDGTGETINVTGATAVVPKAYTAWKANTAYTYVFKITKNTNGTTGGTSDPEGLFPITFDAVVEDVLDDTNEQGTISTLGTYSITTYQAGSVDGNNIKYVTGKEIDVTVMNIQKNATTPANDKYTDVTAASGATITVTDPSKASVTVTSATSTTPAKFTPTTAGEYTITYTSGTTPAVTVTKIVEVK